MRILICYIIVLSTFAGASFTRNNGVVTDSLTRLQWQDDYSDNSDQIPSLAWIDSIDYCENLTLAGSNGWRLPSINELSSIVDYSKHESTINAIFEFASSRYWSSTTSAGNDNASYAWGVNFSVGTQSGGYRKSNSTYVRCVRAGQ